MNLRSIIVAFVATFSIAACTSNGQNIVTTKQTADLLEKGGVTMLDVRTPEEWAEGVIEGAELKNFYDEDFADHLETLDKDQPIIITCKRGGRSAKAAAQMREAGFKEVYDMRAGMDGWNDDKFPTVAP